MTNLGKRQIAIVFVGDELIYTEHRWLTVYRRCREGVRLKAKLHRDDHDGPRRWFALDTPTEMFLRPLQSYGPEQP